MLIHINSGQYRNVWFLRLLYFFLAISLIFNSYGCIAEVNNSDDVANKPRLVFQIGPNFKVTDASFSPDGRFLAIASADRTVKLLNVETGRGLRSFEGHTNLIETVAFSPDGKTLLTASADLTAKLWNIETGVVTQTFENIATGDISFFMGLPDVMVHAAFVPNSKYILTFGNTAKLWNIDTGKEVPNFFPDWRNVNSFTFTPNGRYVVTEESVSNQPIGTEDKFSKKLTRWSVSNGQLLNTFEGSSQGLALISFSLNGRYALISSKEQTVKLWNIESWNEILNFGKHSKSITTLTFSPNNKYVLVASHDGIITLWNINTGEKIHSFENAEPINFGMFSQNGNKILTMSNKIAKLWDIKIGKNVKTYEATSSFTPITHSLDGKHLLVKTDDQNNGKSLEIWNVETLEKIHKLFGDTPFPVGSVDFSPDGSHIATGTWHGETSLWATKTGKLKHILKIADNKPIDVAFTYDGYQLLTENWDSMSLWNVETGSHIRSFGEALSISSIDMSPKAFHLLTGTLYEKATLWDLQTGQVIGEFGSEDYVDGVAFSPDGQYALTSANEGAELWNIKTGSFVQNFSGEYHIRQVVAVDFSPDGNNIVTGSWDESVILWDVESGKPRLVLGPLGDKVLRLAFSPKGHQIFVEANNGVAVLWEPQLKQVTMEWQRIVDGAFSPDGNYIILGSSDGTTQIWTTNIPKKVVELITFPNQKWAVVAPDGRYDTNSPGDLSGLSWVMPDDPSTSLPVEIFMKEYFEPRLLPRLLKGEALPSIKSVAELNRVQPKIEIVQITPNRDNLALISVTIKVAGNQKDFQRNGKIITQTTGVHDLRLFRDGQLVAYAPKTAGEIKLDPLTNNTKLTLKNIRLPRKKGIKQVEFSAHAFNDDGVKSSTVRKTYTLPKNLQPRKGNVYLISIGVNAYENPAWDLNFAANDARAIQAVLSKKIAAAQSNYAAIVPITLISEYQYQQGQRILTSNRATKPIIQALFNKLAGQTIESTLLAGIPNADKLQTAQPEDLLLLSFSSHGHADNKGNFYLFPYDIGPGNNKEITESLLSHTISSEELSLWLRDVDAGDMVMIIDACHSAASVEGEGFKPGPMGSRGLGQLAYDKGMRILTASQADDIALEHDDLEHGFLTYSLIQDGIQAGKADWKPQDLQIMLGEWLQYGEKRVPELYAEVRNGKLKTYNRGRVIREEKELSPSSRFGQQPSLFDFTKRTEDMVVARTRQ